MIFKSNRTEMKKISKYLFSSLISNLTALLVFLSVDSLSPETWFTLLLSYSCGTTMAYLINRIWTFRDQKQPKNMVQILRYLLAVTVGYLLNLFCFQVLFGLGFEKIVSEFFSVLFTGVVLYLFQRFFVFQRSI